MSPRGAILCFCRLGLKTTKEAYSGGLFTSDFEITRFKLLLQQLRSVR
jgi:hypothetical protein